MHETNRQTIITNIQVLRAYCCIAVVIYHTNYFLIGNIHTDYQAVAILFTISGFIMTHIIHENPNHFWIRRIIRIVPLYWIFTLIAFFLPYYHYSSPFNLGVEETQTPSFLLKSLFFFPYYIRTDNPFPSLGVGWTLNLEMFFYALMAIALKISRRWAALLACLMLESVKILNVATDYSVPLLRAYSDNYKYYPDCFPLGVMAYYLWCYFRQMDLRNARIGLIITSVFIGISMIGINAYTENTYLSLTYLFPFSVVCLALLLHTSGLQSRWKFAILLGDASYALYLVHPFWIAMQQFLARQWSFLDASIHFSALCLTITISCILAIMVHCFIEKPILRALKNLL